jgi:hypothetical protein
VPSPDWRLLARAGTGRAGPGQIARAVARGPGPAPGNP